MAVPGLFVYSLFISVVTMLPATLAGVARSRPPATRPVPDGAERTD